MTSPIVVHTFAVQLGFLQLTGFGLAMLLAFWISQVTCERELARRGHDPSPMADVIFAAVLGTLVGAKLYFVILNGGDLRQLFTRAGFVFWGGFIGAVIACYLTIRYKKVPFSRISDVSAIGIAAGYAVGRTGCWAVGDDYGRPWNGPFAVTFPEGAPASTVANMTELFHIPVPAGASPSALVGVHPTQLYEVVGGFIMFLILWRNRGHRHAEGWLFGLYCVLAGIERFLVEIVRAKDDRFFGFLTTAQVLAIAIASLGAAWMYARRSPGSNGPGIYAPAAA
jgi:phosphatidylglycerol---prolipoprotein diacylglyceryl transferase